LFVIIHRLKVRTSGTTGRLSIEFIATSFFYTLVGSEVQAMAGSPDSNVFKILILGDAGVGKSCLLLRYTDNTYKDGFISTIGVDFKLKQLELEGKQVRLKIWDTAGQERFRTITSSYYRGADGIILVYDVTDVNALEGVRQWLNEINRYAANEADRILVGNKIDNKADKRIETVTAEEFAEGLGFTFFETSAKEGTGVNEMFQALTRKIMDRVHPTDNGNKKTGVVEIKQISPKPRRRCDI